MVTITGMVEVLEASPYMFWNGRTIKFTDGRTAFQLGFGYPLGYTWWIETTLDWALRAVQRSQK